MNQHLVEAIAIIPARGGSKGVPRKNVKKVGGYPIIARAIRACQQSGKIDQVWVTTDNDEIAEVAKAYGAGVVKRPDELANDGASSESALLHALSELQSQGIEPKVVAFIQATSPFIPADSLANAVRRVATGNDDVVFSAFETYAFIWKHAANTIVGANHNHAFRPRRQDRDAHFQETGAFYVMETKGFLKAKFRFFGRVGIEVVPEEFAVEIDTPADLEVARRLAPAFDKVPVPAGVIKALVMDFDGVHTDDTVNVDSDGVESVRVSRSDGMGIGLLREAGVPMLIISKETNSVVQARAKKLQIEAVNGIDDKLTELKKWTISKGLELEDVLYIGNDINDADCLRNVGWPVVPADANPEILHLAKIVLNNKGGRGAIREVADLIFQSSAILETQE